MTNNQTIDGVPRELKPCPLCGSDKVSLSWDVYDTDRGRRTQSQIQCLGCRILTKTFKSHAEARAYWNNRAAQPQGGPVAFPGYPPVPEDRKLPTPLDYGSLDAVQRLAVCRGEQVVAVVLPEREMYCQYLRGVIPDNRLEVEAHKDGWNACLDELKRLNPSL